MRDVERVWSRWWHRVVGTFLFILAFGVTIYAAATSSQPPATNGLAPSSTLNISLVVIAGLIQLGSVAVFSSNGKPNAVHAAASVRRLVSLTSRTQSLSIAAEVAKDQSAVEMRVALTDLSARLNYIAQDTLASVEDWTSFNDAARLKAEDMNRLAEDGTVAIDETGYEGGTA